MAGEVSLIKWLLFSRRTTLSQHLLQDLLPKVESFVLQVQKLILLHKNQLSFENMDETLLWLDMPGDTMMARSGE